MELIFCFFKTREFNRRHNAKIVPVVIPMLVAITHHASVVASMQCMVDVSKVVTSHLTLRIPMPTVVERLRRTNYFSLINNACLREQELVQPGGIGAESANAFGEFVGGHGILVQGQSKAGLVVVQLRLVRPAWV